MHGTATEVSKTLKAGKKRRTWKFWTAIVVVLAVVGVIGVSALSSGPRPTEYESAEVTTGTLVIEVTATGQLQPLNQVEVGAEVSGLVQDVLVDFNDLVTAGQVLARIDTEVLEANVVQAEAALASAVASEAEANATAREVRAQRDRVRALVQQNNASNQALETQEAAYARARAGVARAEAGVVQAQAAVDSARSRLDEAVIRSPIDGIVLDRLIEPGQTVAASFQTPHLFTIAQDLSEMELQVDVDEADIGLVTQGQQATFTVDAYPTRTFSAVIAQVRNAPRTISGVVSYEALLLVSNPDLALKPGMTAVADITVDTLTNATLVPNGALRFVPPDLDEDEINRPVNSEGVERGQVWMQGEDGTPTPYELVVGASDGRVTQVLEGAIEAGQSVITDIARNTR